MNYYEYDGNDIAKTLKKAINESADPAAVKYLLNERNNKIDAGGEKYASYKNDALTQRANEYINKYAAGDVNSILDAQRELAVNNLIEAGKRNRSAYNEGIVSNGNAYADARSGIYSAYQRGAASNEERFAAMGLGRGGSKAASSGFGETSRMAANAAYQNNVYNSYKSQAADEAKLSQQYMANQAQAQQDYNDAVAKLGEKQAEYGYQAEKDRAEQNRYATENEYEHALEKLKATGRVTDEQQAQVLGLDIGTTTAEYEDMIFSNSMELRKFDSDEEQRAFDNSMAVKKFDSESEQNMFERAYELFKSTGKVINESMASVLGIPVGTDYWEYVIAAKNANTNYLNYTVKSRNAATSARKAAASASRAASSAAAAAENARIKYLNYEVSKQNADTKRYQAETDRMKITGDY